MLYIFEHTTIFDCHAPCSKERGEMRIELGNDIFRLLGFLDSGNLVILTNGFVKKTQRTPDKRDAGRRGKKKG